MNKLLNNLALHSKKNILHVLLENPGLISYNPFPKEDIFVLYIATDLPSHNRRRIKTIDKLYSDQQC